MEKWRRAHEKCLNSAADIQQALHKSLQNKVAVAKTSVKALKDQEASLSTSIDSLMESHGQLQAALQAQEGPFCLCAWRQGQREKRPLREQVRDPVMIALGEERALLGKTDENLHAAIKTTLTMVSTLQMKRDELRHEIHQKSHALKVDEVHLNCPDLANPGPPLPNGPCPVRGSRPTSAYGSQRSSRRASSTVSQYSRPSSARGFEVRGSPGHTGPVDLRSADAFSRQNETPRRCSTAQQEHAAARICSENVKLARKCMAFSAEAKGRTERALQERVSEMQQAMKQMEREALETRRNQTQTKAILSETRTQMESLQEPMALCSKHTFCHKSQAEQQVTDPVEAKICDQKWQLLRTTQELRRHRKKERNILNELEDHLQRLKEDLDDKSVALAIDLSCLAQSKSNAFMTQGRFR